MNTGSVESLRYPSEDALQAVYSGETVTVQLDNGETVEANLATLADLQSNLPGLISEAWERRNALRSSFLSPGAWGLTPREQNSNQAPVWTLEDAFGQLPFGVPCIRFDSQRVSSVRWRRSVDPGNTEETWKLLFHSRPDVVLGEVAWNDADGLARLVETLLKTPVDDLVTEAALLHQNDSPGFRRDARGRNDLVERVASLPHIAEEKLREASSALTTSNYQVQVAPVRIMDPSLCRYVEFPGLVQVCGHPGSAPTVDRALKSVGLTGLPTRSQSLRYQDISRLAVLSPAAKRAIGTLSSQETDAIGQDQGSARWNNNTVVLNPDPISFDDWQKMG